MNKRRRLLTVSITIALTFALAVQVMAVSPDDTAKSVYYSARNCLDNGPYLYKFVSGSNNVEYVKILQSYLWRFSDECRDQLRYGNNCIDGDYGGRTVNAVKVCQKDLNLNQDGEVGSNTWKAISKSLYYHRFGNGYEINLFRARHNTALCTCRAGDNLPYLCYLTQSDDPVICINLG